MTEPVRQRRSAYARFSNALNANQQENTQNQDKLEASKNNWMIPPPIKIGLMNLVYNVMHLVQVD
ncbi:hypothetical protein [Methyloglobulus sp.]|uniref:hypothetical protein n=1 Tax=Methyloglobulus sp. TaxID=2518622 RepID=UPI003989A722